MILLQLTHRIMYCLGSLLAPDRALMFAAVREWRPKVKRSD